MADGRQPAWRPHVRPGADLSDPKRPGRERCSPVTSQSAVTRRRASMADGRHPAWRPHAERDAMSIDRW
eukprot:1387934-Rhodomonas_salina.2